MKLSFTSDKVLWHIVDSSIAKTGIHRIFTIHKDKCGSVSFISFSASLDYAPSLYASKALIHDNLPEWKPYRVRNVFS